MAARSRRSKPSPTSSTFAGCSTSTWRRRGCGRPTSGGSSSRVSFQAPHHISIEELLAVVRKDDSKIGYATVYRTLKLLTECGVAFERKFGDGLTRYELADDEGHHDHLICVECSKIVEFEEAKIEELQERVAKDHGFQLQSHKHELYGVCADCRRQEN